ncbi:energy transducer TonB [Novosphingobium sp. 9]|uniref:energy transducer TonB n=1 Tax=Novosphingobium sp. 9 TaxID=2025349 RepID=UPI0021B53E95|nr:energy transducer TonB [Novosphingobium sp. 9]
MAVLLAMSGAAGAAMASPVPITGAEKIAESMQGKAQAPRPNGNPGAWVLPDDYPKGGAQGRTGVRLAVAADGRVTSCTVTSSSGNDELDQTACARLAERATFYPATNDKGRAVAGTYSTAVKWTQDEEGRHLAPGATTMIIDVEADGSVADCRMVEATGMFAGREEQAEAACRKSTYAPFHDDKGNPVPRRVTVKNSISIDPAP